MNDVQYHIPSTVVLLLIFFSQWSRALSQTCDLDCHNGECEFAPPDDEHPSGFQYCLCPAGSLGDFCEESGPAAGDDIESSPAAGGDVGTTSCDILGCQNSGECEFAPPDPQHPSGFHYCVCPANYQGDFCEIAPDPCDLNCNGGECQMLAPDEQNINGFKFCTCPPGLLGDYCERGEPEKACDLQCLNGGSCEWGTAGSDNENDQFSYCLCPPGVSGRLCEEEEALPCGDHPCQNGGRCMTGNDGERYCDCSTSNHPTVHYAGIHCEYEATIYCSPSKQYFCVNGGRCISQGAGTYSCDCDKGWSGPSCEFESHDRDDADENCTLTCYNDGVCRKGAKDTSAAAGFGPELSHLADEAAQNQNLEHCVCKDGFTGAKCEYEYEECGNGEHMCLHGSKCVPPKNELHPLWTCECEEAFREDHKYAGKFCQHHHTSTCTTDDAQNQVYMGYPSLTYCFNDGVCTTVVENGEMRPGCRCPEGYTGAHCELLDTNLHQDGATLATDGSGVAALIFFLSVLSILLVVLVGVVILRFRRGKDWGIESAHLCQDAGHSSSMEEVDFADEDEDGIMEDVELL